MQIVFPVNIFLYDILYKNLIEKYQQLKNSNSLRSYPQFDQIN